jgi:hypothetical protein
MALDKIIADLPKNGGRNILEVVEELRKSLLTRKVTKWFDVYQHGDSFNMSTCLWDSKAAAENDPSPYRIGTYPIEVPQKPPVKKVAKWVIVSTPGIRGHEPNVYQGRLWDSEPAAKRHVDHGCCPEDVMGVFPVEIEVPL